MTKQEREMLEGQAKDLSTIAASVELLQSVFSGLNCNYKFIIEDTARLEKKILQRDKVFYDMNAMTQSRLLEVEKKLDQRAELFTKVNDDIMTELINIKKKIEKNGKAK